MKLEHKFSNFSCEQIFEKTKSMSVWTIINIFHNNKQKLTNDDVCEEQIRDFNNLERLLDSHKKLITCQIC